jgi:biotin-dependent carboxylase-like uncharacterized protein
MSIEVLKPGPLSSLQDLGRTGVQRFGVIASGVMDEWSHRLANLLVGNAHDEASLEITLMGPSLLFHQDALIALVGADLSARIGEQPIPMSQAVRVPAGARLDFGRRVFGCRAYLAVHGGFAVPAVMGSRSTYLRAGFGGLQGRALRKGDHLPIAPDALGAAGQAARPFATPQCAPTGPAPGSDALPVSEHPARQDRPIRLIRGQQWEHFTADAQARLFEAPFVVNLNSDRMGYRLDGPGLPPTKPLEMISEAVGFGTMQVPPDGQPIVLMADRQTTGGYPKIASVASVDLPLMAQRVPGETLRFAPISLDEAQALYLDREREFARIRSLIPSFDR